MKPLRSVEDIKEPHLPIQMVPNKRRCENNYISQLPKQGIKPGCTQEPSFRKKILNKVIAY